MRRIRCIIMAISFVLLAVLPCFAEDTELSVTWDLGDSDISYYRFGFRKSETEAINATESMAVTVTDTDISGSFSFQVYWEFISSLSLDLVISIDGPMSDGFGHSIPWTIAPTPPFDNSFDNSWKLDSSEGTLTAAIHGANEKYTHDAGTSIKGEFGSIAVTAMTNLAPTAIAPVYSGSYSGTVELNVKVR